MKETVILVDREYLLEEKTYTPIVKENLFEKQGGEPTVWRRWKTERKC